MTTIIRLGALPDVKIPLLVKMAKDYDLPNEWQAKLVFPRRLPGGLRDAPLRLVNLAIGSDDPRHVREARFRFGKLFERCISTRAPQVGGAARDEQIRKMS